MYLEKFVETASRYDTLFPWISTMDAHLSIDLGWVLIKALNGRNMVILFLSYDLNLKLS